MKQIFLVRHGQSMSNVHEILSARKDDTPLSPLGREQARQAGRELKGKGVELIVCSPMNRTRETASIIAKEIGYDSDKVEASPLFIERDYGVYDGQHYSVYKQDSTQGKVQPGVETTEQMFERLSKGLEWLAEQPAQKIVVVTHSGASRAIRTVAQQLHHSEMYKMPGLKNAEIYELEL